MSRLGAVLLILGVLFVTSLVPAHAQPIEPPARTRRTHAQPLEPSAQTQPSHAQPIEPPARRQPTHALPTETQPAQTQPTQPRSREAWLAMAKGGFVRPAGVGAYDLLVEMNGLLFSTDPVLRDEVAYGAAERWILRDKALAPEQLRALIALWSANLERGLGETGTDTVFGRSFSALCLSVIAAADLSSPFLEPAEVGSFFDRTLDYFARERDVRGFDATRGWMHSVAHTADVLKFLARNPKLPAGADRRLLEAIRLKLDATDLVFAWGEPDRLALALQSALRRPDADAAALEAFTAYWVEQHRALWAGGPHVEPRRFARVENAKLMLRSVHAALAMEQSPTANGTAAARTILAALARMR